MSRSSERSTDRESGQALLEFALVAPILLFLVMAIFQFAFVLQAQMGLTNAVREAARRGAAAVPADQTSFGTWIQGELTNSGGLLGDNVQGYQSGRLVGTPTVGFCTYTTNGLTGQRVTVSVTYNYPIFFPILSFALGGGTDWQLSASAQMRLENPLALAPSTTC